MIWIPLYNYQDKVLVLDLPGTTYMNRALESRAVEELFSF